MLKKVTALEFNNIVSTSIYTNTKYMEITAKVMQARAVYYVFFRNDLPQVAFALFEKSKKIVLPGFYPLYSGVWLNGSLEKLNLRKDFVESILKLKALYNSISICLPPDIQDVRAFIWNGFDVKLKYTYVKNLNVLNFKSDVLKNYRLALKDFNFFEEIFQNKDWVLFKNQLFKIGFSQKKIDKLKNWLFTLSDYSFIKVFSIKNKDMKLVGIGIILLNQAQRNTGFLLSYALKNEQQSEINSILYVGIHKWLIENGFYQFDYFGANTINIADFKSRFNPELKTYFVVSYSKFSLKNINNNLISFKNILHEALR